VVPIQCRLLTRPCFVTNTKYVSILCVLPRSPHRRLRTAFLTQSDYVRRAGSSTRPLVPAGSFASPQQRVEKPASA
jgi:hypothetical protein